MIPLGRCAAIAFSALTLMSGFSGTVVAQSSSELIDGFNKTVFGSEYSKYSTRSYVRKFNGEINFHVSSQVAGPYRDLVLNFVESLPRLIDGLKVSIVKSERKANFVIYVVSRSAYAATVRQKVYKNRRAVAHGHCMVRAISTRGGIRRSVAVVVADQGDELFKRCMIEEILQGLGPLNDDPSLKSSMFNDESRFSSLQIFDRYILNMLYHPAIKPGLSLRRVQPRLPAVVEDVRRRLEARR